MTLTSLPAFVAPALEYAIETTRRNLARLTDFPELAAGGEWVCHNDGWWTGGHWTGLLWLAFAHTGEPQLERAARAWTERLAPRQFDTTTHDLGFLFELSYVLGYRLTGDRALLHPPVQAARTLAARFNRQGRFMQAWGPLDGSAHERGRAIIDTIMNLDLLYWAARVSGENAFAEIASAIADTILERHVRPDWSTVHVADFDPATGRFIKVDTQQGLSATSCWARGQAWVIYGFGKCFAKTWNPAYLDAARHLATYALRRLPADLVPYWDYDSPLIPDDVRDSSAASIIASGLLNLAQVETDAARADRWRAQAIAMLQSLWDRYSSRGTIEPCILLHGTRSKPEGSMDHGLIYGDYYFAEALTRVLRPDLAV